MKKILIAMFLLITMLACTPTAFAAPLVMSKMPFGKVTVHTASGAGGVNAVVVENDKLVIFDAFEDKEDAQAFKKFIESLGKPVDRIVLSHAHDHHFKGAETVFINIAFYSVDAADINKQAPMNVQPLTDGQQVIDSVDYEFVTYRDLGAWVIKMPAQKMAMVHHLGYDGLHFPMPPMDARLDILKGLEREGYSLYTGGHGKVLADKSIVQLMTDYTKTVTEAVAANKDPQGAKAAIMAKYPTWAGDGLLDRLLPLFYKQ